MSFFVDLCVWMEEDELVDIHEILGAALECVAVPNHNDSDGSILNRFRRVSASLVDSSNVVYDRDLNTNETEPVVQELVRFAEPGVTYRITSAFDRFNYRDGRVEATVAPLDIHYYGPQFGWRGQNYKRQGCFVFYFMNTKVFRIPDELIKDLRLLAQSRQASSALPVISQLRQNFEAVNGLALRLIKSLNPKHVLVCTEAEVHPLTAHAIYHRDWRDYLRDYSKIVSLHERGGTYFCSVEPDEPAFVEPCRVSHDYGHLRHYSLTQEEFVERVEALVSDVIADQGKVEATSREVFENWSLRFDDTEVLQINDSYYLYAGEGPFAYLDEAYFEIWAAYTTRR